MSSVKPIIVEVASAEVQNISGTSKIGNPYSINKQKAYAFVDNSKYPKEIELTLKDNQPPYQVGKYYVDLNTCAYVDRYGCLGVSQNSLNLVQIQDKA